MLETGIKIFGKQSLYHLNLNNINKTQSAWQHKTLTRNWTFLPCVNLTKRKGTPNLRQVFIGSMQCKAEVTQTLGDKSAANRILCRMELWFLHCSTGALFDLLTLLFQTVWGCGHWVFRWSSSVFSFRYVNIQHTIQITLFLYWTCRKHLHFKTTSVCVALRDVTKYVKLLILSLEKATQQDVIICFKNVLLLRIIYLYIY